MVIAYLCAMLFPWTRGHKGFLLVLGDTPSIMYSKKVYNIYILIQAAQMWTKLFAAT